jgi:hypothetical protein
MTFGIGDDVALTALSVVFTDWLSMTPAVGLAARPALSRAAITSMWLMATNVPLRDHS